MRNRNPLERLASALALVAVLALLLGAASASGAEIRRMEVVGAVPLDAETRRSGIPKDKAIDEALFEGVWRVAYELLEESAVELVGSEPTGDGGAASEGPDPIRAALGTNMVLYATSFRILDDQGERPTLFTDHPDAATEYVVVVEVQVDVDRVRDRLRSAGLLEVPGGGLVALSGIEIEIRGLTDYRGFQALKTLIESDSVGVETFEPREFGRGRTLLRVEAEWGATELLERLLAAAPPELRITPMDVDDPTPSELDGWGRDEPAVGSLVLEIAWTPPPSVE
jgi:hypothetical protein